MYRNRADYSSLGRCSQASLYASKQKQDDLNDTDGYQYWIRSIALMTCILSVITDEMLLKVEARRLVPRFDSTQHILIDQ
jgi:hypothetical protein